METSTIIITIVIVIIIILIIVIVIYFIFNTPILAGPCRTPGAFRDFLLNQCFICPEGMDRNSLAAITSQRGCQGLCPEVFPDQPGVRGSFEDGLSGVCFHCPQGMVPNVFPSPSDPRKCAGSCPDVFPGQPGGSFPDAGTCYHCPAGFVRTIGFEPITSARACTTTNNPFDPNRRFARSIRDGSPFSAAIRDGNRFAPGKPVT